MQMTGCLSHGENVGAGRQTVSCSQTDESASAEREELRKITPHGQ